MDISWDDVQLFLAVAETGSMSAAAKRLQVGQPTVSRRVGELEHQLGFSVFERSVAGARLTSEGARLLGPATEMARWAAELERQVERAEAGPSGPVRITAPPGVAYDLLAPFAATLREDLPEVQLHIASSIRVLDLTRREADLALRLRESSARDHVTLYSFEYEVAAFATPDYIACLPDGYGFADVDWIAWASPFEDRVPNPQLEEVLPGFRPAFASDDFLVQLRAVLAGIGAMFFGAVDHPYSVLSQLQRLDLDLGEHSRGSIHVVAAKSALDIPRVRAVAERLIDALSVATHRV